MTVGEGELRISRAAVNAAASASEASLALTDSRAIDPSALLQKHTFLDMPSGEEKTIPKLER